MDCMKYIVNVEGVILKEGKYLMIVRGEDEEQAPGTLATVGGKVEEPGTSEAVLEETLRREIREEVGIEVFPRMLYLGSGTFVTDDGEPVTNVIFLCGYKSGVPTSRSSGEVGDIQWMTKDEIFSYPDVPAWTLRAVELAERARISIGW
jgi:8-oxo-dGTP pyrophosphatase MutT (NUDIX family)